MNFDENELKTSNNKDSHETNFENLFKLYDPNGTGTIKTEDFIAKTQELIRDLNSEQFDLKSLVNELDPFDIGFLSYDQFKNAIGKITNISESVETTKDNDLIDDIFGNQSPSLEKNTSLVSSPFSNNTYGEYDIESSLNMPKNDLDNTFFSFDNMNNSDTSNIPYSQSTSNFYDQSLSKKKILRDRSFQSLPHRQQIPDIIDDNPRLSIAITDDAIENYEEHLQISEKKISELTQQVNYLSNENRELYNQIDRIKSDYELIETKYTELEKVNELNHALEQTIIQLKIENSKLKEEIKTNICTWNDEREIISKKNEYLENQLNTHRDENLKLSQEFNEILKKNEKCEEDFQKLNDNFRRIVNENQKLESDKDLLTDEMSRQLNDCCQKIDSLEQTLEIVKAENENLKNTLTSTIINEAIQPVQNIQDEKLSSQNINVGSVNTKINHLFDDEPTISSTYGVTSGSSLAAEMETSSKDDLLAKLNEEKQANIRLRDYMDKIMLKLWTENQDLFLSCVVIKSK